MQDRERLETLVAMAASNMAISVPSSGHFFAMTAAASSLTPLAGLAELYSGLSQVSSSLTLVHRTCHVGGAEHAPYVGEVGVAEMCKCGRG